MRIILFGEFIDYQIQMANCLSKNNVIMLIIPLNNLSKDYTENINENIGLYLLGRGKKKHHPSNLFIIKDLLTKINQYKPDIIHFQLGGGMSAPLILLIILLLRKKHYPVMTTFHDVKLHIGENSWFQNLLRYWIRKYSDRIIVHGEKLKIQMIKEFNIHINKISVIPIGGHDIALFKKYEKKYIIEDDASILFFGRIYKYKGLDYLIRAEPLIKKEFPNVKIIIAGTGEDFTKYRDMILDKDNFIIKNHKISYEEGAELFQRCNIVVIPYIDASQSGVVPVAYSFKKPVIVTDVGSIPEIVEHCITGLIIPPKNSEAIADAIVTLLKDDMLRKKMGHNGYIKLYKDLSWDKIAEKTVDAYEDIIKKNNEN